MALKPLHTLQDPRGETPPGLAEDAVTAQQLKPHEVSEINQAITTVWDLLRANQARTAVVKQLGPEKVEVTIPPSPRMSVDLKAKLESEISRILGSERSKEFLTRGKSCFQRVFKGFGADKSVVVFQRKLVYGKNEWETVYLTVSGNQVVDRQSWSGLDPTAAHLPGYPKN